VIRSLYRWRLPIAIELDEPRRELARERGFSQSLLRILAGRGLRDPGAIAAFLWPGPESLHDPRLLPDAGPALARIRRARDRGERILVYGDFDTDGLTGLAILVLAFRALGLDAEPYVPERLADGHGLSVRAVELASAGRRSLIVTADCGTSSGPEIELAAGVGIDVVVTDHHHAPEWPRTAVAVVNPRRPDSAYPETQLTGAGVAWKVACLVLDELGAAAGPDRLPPDAVELSDLALIGTVADVAPILGENRSIARMGLERIRISPRPGIAALLERAGLAADRLDLEDISFAVAPRLNSAGRVGEAARAARLLMAADRAEADVLAADIETANRERRDITRTAVAEARRQLGLEEPMPTGPQLPTTAASAAPGRAVVDLPAALLVAGEWPVGIIGLIAGRLAEELDRPTVVASIADPDARVLRGSCRGPDGFNLAEALIGCQDLLLRHGGHSAAAGFDMDAANWPQFTRRFVELAAARQPRTGPRELAADLVLPAEAVDYPLLRELALLEPCGTGNPSPVLAITGLRVVRVRPAAGGHSQLVLGRRNDVLDGVAFRRADLPGMLAEGDRIDVIAQASSRSFGGFESIQLQVLDVSAEGAQIGTPAAGGPG
jgi:single-stranded-DNA-specific exonuclease